MEVKLKNIGPALISANFHLHPWDTRSDEEIDNLIDDITIQLTKLAQHYDLDVVDEEGYIIKP